MKTSKFIVPIYGVESIKNSPLQLEDKIIIRNINLFENEHEIFKKNKLRTYEVVVEIEYVFNEENASEPYPGISLRFLNLIDASLVVYGEGKVGLAAIIPIAKSKEYFPFILSHEIPQYDDYLNKEIDEHFVTYYDNFKKAYGMRPMAFDLFRRSQERFTNNDRTIDSCTILESILVPKGEKSKKLFITSGLKIMGYSKNEVLRIEKLIDYRNAIIHADREKLLSLYKGSEYTFSWFEETFKLVREILYKYVEKPWD